MSKQSQPKRSSQRNKYLTMSGVAIALLIAAFALIASSRGTTSAAQKLSPSDYQSQFEKAKIAYLLVDVRTPDEFATGHIHGAVNIPLDTLETRLNEVSRTEPVVVYCHSGNRSAKAAQILANAGYTRIYDLGGINAWTEQGLPIE
ncbi:MAG: rhodanese-like domain-containing protein [Anaerolineaceae bacterium]|nr:rhodanese-like domain-containing protein [Anaerolineaceae bacterium]